MPFTLQVTSPWGGVPPKRPLVLRSILLFYTLYESVSWELTTAVSRGAKHHEVLASSTRVLFASASFARLCSFKVTV